MAGPGTTVNDKSESHYTGIQVRAQLFPLKVSFAMHVFIGVQMLLFMIQMEENSVAANHDASAISLCRLVVVVYIFKELFTVMNFRY